jgi:hypothetical protein
MKILLLCFSIVIVAGCDKSKSRAPSNQDPNIEKNGSGPESNGTPENSGQEGSGQLTEAGVQNFAVSIGSTKWQGSINQQKQIALNELPTEYAIEIATDNDQQSSELNLKYRQQCSALVASEAQASLVHGVSLRLQNYPRDTEILEGIRYQVRKNLEKADLSIAAPSIPVNRNLNFDSSARSATEGKLNDAFISWSQKGATLAVLAFHGTATTSLPLGTLCDILDRKISMSLDWQSN